ncbi:ABC transporter substrate-binding protein [Zongyangia hominis]|uniref:Spermidine/putrescine ABC transporter substrate-binding protein n=1 Tax=Zongyangia hominis TaxID=2763677 RepID=A0A926IAP7_9FIRM|nr:spermidine/putrescine ABC transporter substrate-binding protein [Zongyangia hominis]MBC8569433.1 spermidine/putrescine ABC transporter substrate-binding protein [Zongyangia hominis]
MKKLTAALLAALLLLLFAVPAFAEIEVEDESYYQKFKGQGISINVYNWGEYISDGAEEGTINVNKEFEDLTGIKVNYSTFASNEELYAKLKSGGANYDIIIPSDYMIGRMIKENMLEPLNFENIPAFKNISSQFVNPIYDPDNAYSVPYTWGTVGIIYNTTMVDGDVDSWDILWDARYMGDILMFANSRDAFAIAQKRLGYSFNTGNPDELEKAAESLKEQKPLVQAYVMDEIFDKMQAGEAALAPYYAGDAITMIADNPDLAFAVPREGTNRFVDAICIPKGSQQQEAAEMYINFLCEPEVGLANCEYIGYSTPNDAAMELLDDEMRNNPIAYPSEEVLQNTETFLSLDDDANKLMDKLWTDIMSTNEGTNQWLIPVFLVLCIVASITINVVRRIRKKRDSMY